jgi:DNA polymerase III subunit epsilon
MLSAREINYDGLSQWSFPYVILDLETTGGTPLHDRIIEIALIRFEEGMESDRWETLVNPGMPISPFITRLTGISNGMAQDAPSFEEVAHKLYSFLEGAVLAAHNVRFDYGFLKNEYRRRGALLQHRVLCTVRLSHKLYPQHKGHGLDGIVQRHGLHTDVLHRAMGDVELVVAYLEVARRELGSRQLLDAASALLKDPSLPARLDAAVVDHIPDSPGVYFFYGKNDLPLYIGKSVTLRSRVMSHFSNDHASSGDMRIAQEAHSCTRARAGTITPKACASEKALREPGNPQVGHSTLQQNARVVSKLGLTGLSEIFEARTCPCQTSTPRYDTPRQR